MVLKPFECIVGAAAFFFYLAWPGKGVRASKSVSGGE